VAHARGGANPGGRRQGSKKAKRHSAEHETAIFSPSGITPRKNRHVITGGQGHCEVSVIAIKYPARTRRHTRTVRVIRILPRPSLEHFLSGPSSNGCKTRNSATLESPIERRHFIYLSQERNWESLAGRPTAAAGRRGRRENDDHRYPHGYQAGYQVGWIAGVVCRRRRLRLLPSDLRYPMT
jgi:hypothetical protein